MKHWKRNIVLSLALVSAASVVQAQSGTLANLERERAALLETMLDEQLSPDKRNRQLAMGQRHLLDLERMVIRDDRLLGSKDPMVTKAFENYDLTFLVHASAEGEQHVVDFWLGQLHIDSQSILTSHKGRR